MEQAAILKSGDVVKLSGLTNPQYSIYGFLTSFEVIIKKVINGVEKEITEKYSYTVQDQFKLEDLVGQVNKDVSGGFYEEQFFLGYLAGKNKLYELKNHKYQFKAASYGDEIIVRKLKVVDPYTDFCKIETYKWKHKPNTLVLDVETRQITIPAGVVPNPLLGENVQLNNIAMQFYSHKIGLFVTPLADTNDKQAKAFLFAKIAIRINLIIQDIFSLFETENNTDFGSYLNNQTYEWANKLIFANPTIEILEDYLRNLNYFYKSAYANKLSIKTALKEDKFYWLARALSVEGLATVPTIDKIMLLEKISGFRKQLTEYNEGEALVLKIVESFTMDSVSAEDRNDFLNELMKNQIYDVNYNGRDLSLNQHKTLFEVLYSKIDDNRLERYTIGPLAFTFGLLKTKDNRKAFILMLYKIWKSSTYNPKYADPSYTQPANNHGIYPQSYYMRLIDGAVGSNGLVANYNPETSPALLVYNSSSSSSSTGSTDYYLKTTDVNYILGNIKGKKVEVYKVKTNSRLTSTSDGPLAFSLPSDKSLYGTYELYQPISLIGFKPDLDLVETFKDPENGVVLEGNKIPNIPAFFLYYMQDYSDLKKLDFGIVAIAEIAMNLTGVGALNDLKYLGYLSKARSVWSGTATASETVLFWKAVEGVNNAVQFTADNLASINNYANNTTTDSDVKEFTDKVSVLFDIITIVSLGTDPIMKRKLFDSAASVLAQERKLITLGKPHGLNADAMDAIRAIYDVESLIDLMQLKLNNLTTGNDNILATFSTFTKDEKYEFFAYFYNIDEGLTWARMNVVRYRTASGTIEEYTWVDLWKNDIKYLKKQRTFEFLEVFDFIAYDARCNRLREHIFKGHINSNGSVGGIHSYVAVTDGHAQIENILKNYSGGYYMANVSAIDETGNVFPKTANAGMNSMLPNSWTKQKVLEEISFAFNNKFKKPGTYNQFVGKFTDGQKCIICINGNSTNIDSSTKIITFWPDLK